MLSALPSTDHRYTLDEFEQLFLEEEYWRYELLDGELLVRPSFPTMWHQDILVRLLRALDSYARPKRIGRVAPGAFVVPPDTELHPDILITPWGPPRPWRELTEWLLAVEVLSPSTRRVDLRRKRPRYIRHGVEELWLVDPEKPSVIVARRGVPDRVLQRTASLNWQPRPEIAPLTIDLASLFADE